jgi:hypothetical protein
MQLVSTQLWDHHQAMIKNWRNEMYMEVPYGIPFDIQSGKTLCSYPLRKHHLD